MHGPRYSVPQKKRRKTRTRRKSKRPRKSQKTMSIQHKTLKLCNCNKTLPLDAEALGAALKIGAPVIHTELCRKQAARFQGALGDAEVLVGCTQEAALFNELA